MVDFEKAKVSMRYWLLGSKMHNALNALEYAGLFHTGTRKDGVTPEYYHQLSIAHYIRTFLHHVDDPETALASAFLHDVCEDYNVGFEEIETKFGVLVADAVKQLTKKHRGVYLNEDDYYNGIGQHKIASVVKGADRVNNIQTMVHVFSREKQVQYLKETVDCVIPMLKTSRRLFTTQEGAYENMKIMLRNQVMLIEAIHHEQNR